MVMDNFDEKKWLDRCRRYENNKKGLGFDTFFSFADEKGKIKFKNLDQRYKKTMTGLVTEVIQGAIIFLDRLIASAGYAEEKDQEHQYELHKKEYHEYLENYIRILLEEGVEKMMDVFSAKQELIKFSYLAARMVYEDGKWIASNGDYFVNGFFIDHITKEPYRTITTPVWDILLNAELPEEEQDETIELDLGRAC